MSETIRIGAHVDQTDPVAEAQARDTTLVQFFLGDPQSYKGPEVRYAGGAEALRSAAEDAGVDLYVHAPYIINVATTNNRIRIPSRKLLQQHVDAAAEIGAKGLIVHGGHVNKADDPGVGFDNWRKAIDATDLKVPVLIENTAGGDNAMTRHLDRISGARVPRHAGLAAPDLERAEPADLYVLLVLERVLDRIEECVDDPGAVLLGDHRPAGLGDRVGHLFDEIGLGHASPVRVLGVKLRRACSSGR